MRWRAVESKDIHECDRRKFQEAISLGHDENNEKASIFLRRQSQPLFGNPWKIEPRHEKST